MITYYAKLTELESINESKIGGNILGKNLFFVFNRMTQYEPRGQFILHLSLKNTDINFIKFVYIYIYIL